MSQLESKRSGSKRPSVRNGTVNVASRRGRRSRGRNGRNKRGVLKSNPNSSFTPAALEKTLTWAFNASAATSATYGETVFAANSLFDPGQASSASQPLGFDQLAVWYNKYKVIASSISLSVQLASSSATPTASSIGARVVLYPSGTAAAAATFQDAVSQPGAIDRELGSIPVLIKNQLTTKAVLGFGSSDADDSSCALVTANPASLWHWHFGIAAGTYTNVEFVVTVTMSFRSRFYSRVTQALSFTNDVMREAFSKVLAERKRMDALPFKPNLVDEKLANIICLSSHLKSEVKDDSKKVFAALRDIEDVPLSFLQQCGVNGKAESFKFTLPGPAVATDVTPRTKRYVMVEADKS